VRVTQTASRVVTGAVTRRYRFDWQYAVDKARLPLISQASATIAAMPVLVNAGFFGNVFRTPTSPSLWLAWASAMLFLAAYAVVSVRCPRFIQEYRDFGEYTKRDHSHRWVVWEFYNNIERLRGWQDLIAECEIKGIADAFASLAPEEQAAIGPSFTANAKPGVRLIMPVNYKRNIYLPVERGAERIVIYLREDDPDLDKKVKEAFWILYSQAVKERPVSRFLFWLLWYLFVASAAGAIGWNAWSAVAG
jgi:hypothetical protein